MAFERTVTAALGTLIRPQEYDFHWCYERGILTKAWLDVYQAIGDRRFLYAARADADQFIRPSGLISTYEPEKYNLDMVCMGRTALRLYSLTGEEKYLEACRGLAEQLTRQPRTPEGGFWHKAIYPQQMWLDGLYMASPFMAEFGALTGEACWQQEAVRQLTLCFEKTRLPSGLHAHAWDAAHAQRWADPETGLSPHVWGRAMGWFAMAHVDVLAALPEDAPGRDALIRQLRSIAAALLAVRGADGLWHQMLDCPSEEENYGESSATAMAIYAMARGAEAGWLDKQALAAAREAMDALWSHNVVIAADGYPELTRICKVAGLGGEPYRDGSYDYYVHETVCSGDTKGTAPFLMALTALRE